MPVVHKNTLKAARQAEKRRLRNRSIQSTVRNAIKRLQNALVSKNPKDSPKDSVDSSPKTAAPNPDSPEAFLKEAARAIAKAASKGVIHRNTASRKISRLTAYMHKVSPK